MMFALGLITGLLLCTFVLLVLTYFKHSIERHVTVIEKNVSNAGPRPKGFIVEPETEAERVRRAIIERNNRLGRDTTIKELQ